jgi:hypothetical protein
MITPVKSTIVDERARIFEVRDDADLPDADEPLEKRGSLLPFTVRLVRTETHLRKAVAVRAKAFLRHAPKLGAQLSAPEDADRKSGNVVFLAESKITGDPVGSIRVETNARYQTELERAVSLPPSLRLGTLAQVSRLGVAPTSDGSLIKYSLFKAIYLFSVANQIDHLIVAARRPVDKEFSRLGFREVFEQATMLKFPRQGEKLLKLFYFDVASAERSWLEREHPLYSFMVKTYHPDIAIFSSVGGMWSTPRFSSSGHGGFSPGLSERLPFPLV